LLKARRIFKDWAIFIRFPLKIQGSPEELWYIYSIPSKNLNGFCRAKPSGGAFVSPRSQVIMKKILSGNEAIARGAFEHGVLFASAYPGTPSTEVLENISQYKEIHSEWAPNEKVALEAVAGASLLGARCLSACKHVGLNVAADPLLTMTYTGVKGGVVLVNADDPGMHSSQNEQDNRYLAAFAQIPMLEPADSQEALDMVGLCLELSEKFDTPAMLRLTTRVAHSKSVVELGPGRKNHAVAGFERNLEKYCMLPVFAQKRHPLLLQREAALQEYAESAAVNQWLPGSSRVGIVSAGAAYQYAREIMPQASFFKLGMTYPLPRKQLMAFAGSVETLVVVEELEPFLENQLKIMGINKKIAGKEYFPRLGELSPDLVAQGLRAAGLAPDDGVAPGPAAIGKPAMPRPPLLCAGCSHRGVGFVLQKLKAIVTGDIGCYSLTALPPLQAIESILCMGGSISMAHGLAKARRAAGLGATPPVYALIGDSTFFHSGITSLLNAVYNQSAINVIVLDNRITGMTGGQDNPGTGRTLSGEPAPRADIAAICRALGVKRVRVIDAYNLRECEAALREEAGCDEPSVIITNRPCMQLLQPDPARAYKVNAAACIGCGACLRLGCPAIYRGEKIAGPGKEIYRAAIDPALCAACSLCAQLCPKKAIAG
jgi:indolepyruvate ferredoxin oxidoreductase alpha subunit